MRWKKIELKQSRLDKLMKHKNYDYELIASKQEMDVLVEYFKCSPEGESYDWDGYISQHWIPMSVLKEIDKRYPDRFGKGGELYTIKKEKRKKQ